MKTTMKKLFTGALACLTLAAVSCTKDNSTSGGTGDVVAEGGEGYLSIVFKDVTDITAGLGRAGNDLNNTDEDPATPNEKIVDNVLLVLYSGNKVAYAFPYTNSQLLPSKTQTKAEKILKKSYKALVIINPNAAVTAATAVGKTLADLEATQTGVEVTDFTGGLSYNKFMMTNWQGLVDIKTSDIKETDTEAVDNPAQNEVNLERVVAKLNFNLPAGGLSAVTVPANASIVDGSLSWTLDVTNKETFFMRKQALAIIGKTGKVSTLGPEDNNLAHRARNYATDPNFLYAAGDPENHFNWMKNSASWGGISLGNHIYALENTMEADDQMRGVSTTAVLRLKYNPGKSSLSMIVDGSETSATIAPGDCYFIYDKVWVFTGEELDKIEDGTIELDPSKAEGAGAQQAIQYLINSISTLKNDIASKGYASFAAYEAAKPASNNIARGLAFANSNEFNYYRIPVRHYENALQETLMAYGRFGVVRNNSYALTLTEIKGPGRVVPGFDGPDDPDGPDVPDEETEGYISVTFKVLDWVKRTHGVIGE